MTFHDFATRVRQIAGKTYHSVGVELTTNQFGQQQLEYSAYVGGRSRSASTPEACIALVEADEDLPQAGVGEALASLGI